MTAPHLRRGHGDYRWARGGRCEGDDTTVARARGRHHAMRVRATRTQRHRHVHGYVDGFRYMIHVHAHGRQAAHRSVTADGRCSVTTGGGGAHTGHTYTERPRGECAPLVARGSALARRLDRHLRSDRTHISVLLLNERAAQRTAQRTVNVGETVVDTLRCVFGSGRGVGSRCGSL